MNRILNRKQAICGTVWILAVCAALVLWPLRLIQEEVRAVSSRQQLVVSEEVTADYVVQQRFIAQYDRLKEIEIYLADRVEGEKLNFAVRDASMQTLMQQVIDTGDMKTIPGYLKVQVNMTRKWDGIITFCCRAWNPPFVLPMPITREKISTFI